MPKNARRLAAALAGLILLGWGMGVLVLHLAGGFFHGHVDRPVNHWVHAHHSHGVNVALFRVAHLGSDAVTLVVALGVGGIWAIGRRRLEPLAILAMAYGGGAVIALVDKVAVRRGQSGLPGGLAGVIELGFPSGHATLAAAVYGTLAVLLARRTRWIVPAGLAGLALVIGVARVYNGQHYATDVLAGWILGGLWTWALASFAVGRDRLRPAPDGVAGRGEHSRPAPGPPLSVPPASQGTGGAARRGRGRRRRAGRRLPSAAATAAAMAAPVVAVGRVLAGRRG